MNSELVLVHIFENRDKTSCNGISIEIDIVLICMYTHAWRVITTFFVAKMIFNRKHVSIW